MSLQTAAPNTEAAIWARLFQSDETEVTPDVAHYLLSLKFPTADEQRVNELSARARAGTLTDAEGQELDNYLHIASLPAVMQSKAPGITTAPFFSCSAVTRELTRRARERARDQCEYCLLPQSAFPLSFEVDHIVAEKHGGRHRENDLRDVINGIPDVLRTFCLAEEQPVFELFPAKAGCRDHQIIQQKSAHRSGCTVIQQDFLGHGGGLVSSHSDGCGERGERGKLRGRSPLLADGPNALIGI